MPPIVPRLRICGEPTVRDAIARPGQPVLELLDRARVRDARADADRAVVGIPAREVVDAREVEDRLRPGTAEVDVDHHVGPTPQWERFWMARFGLQRLIPVRGLQEFHPRMIFAVSRRRADLCARPDHC